MSSTEFNAGIAGHCYMAGPLAFAEPRQWLRIVDVDALESAAKRLRDLGLIPGARIFLATVGAAGAVVQLTGHGRLAVDLDLAQGVWVEPTE